MKWSNPSVFTWRGLWLPIVLLLCVKDLSCHAGTTRRASAVNVSSRTAPHGRAPSTSRLARSNTGTSSSEKRSLSAVPFVAQYKALFQVLSDPYCASAAPLIHVSCNGPDIQIIATSHPTIVCDTNVLYSQNTTNETSSATISCESTCNSKESCESIHLVHSLLDLNVVNATLPFGAVEFQCRGTELSHVQGSLTFQGVDADCAEFSTLFHTARLGVSCPRAWELDSFPTRAPTAASTARYIYDDHFFECTSGTAILSSISNDSDVLSCETFGFCDLQACQVTVGSISIRSQATHFDTWCLASPTVPTVPGTSPTVPTVVTAQFEAVWGMVYPDDFVDLGQATTAAACTIPSARTAEISCSGNGSRIQRLDGPRASSVASIPMGSSSTSTLHCTETNMSQMKTHVSTVSFECTAPNVRPETRLTVREGTTTCSNGRDESLQFAVGHAVQLGVICRNGTETYVLDTTVRCAASSHRLYPLDPDGARSTNDRFTCAEFVRVDNGFTETIPTVAIQTDRLWAESASANCFTSVAVPLPSQVSDTTTKTNGRRHNIVRLVGIVAGPTCALVLVGLVIGMYRHRTNSQNKNGSTGTVSGPSNMAPQPPPPAELESRSSGTRRPSDTGHSHAAPARELTPMGKEQAQGQSQGRVWTSQQPEMIIPAVPLNALNRPVTVIVQAQYPPENNPSPVPKPMDGTDGKVICKDNEEAYA